MAATRTNIDALGYYESDPATRGGLRADREICAMDADITNPIGPIIVQAIHGDDEGDGTIRAVSATTLAYAAPGDDEGAAVTAPANTSVLLESDTTSKAVRVYRDSVYNSDDLAGTMTLDQMRQFNNAIGGANTDETGGAYYSGFWIYNHSMAPIQSITVANGEYGTQITTDSAQLSGSGAGTITTTDSFADWPTSGWALIRQSGGTVREAVYYSSRTTTSLTVPAAGRGLLGTSAAAGAGTDTAQAIGPIRVWLEAPSGGEVQTIGNNTTEPTSPTWALSDSVTQMDPGEERFVWIRRDVLSSATVNTAVSNRIDIGFSQSGTAYTTTMHGQFRIGDSSLALYKLYNGEDTAPDFTAAALATSATLPFSQALTNSVVNNYCVRYQNQYGLESFNVLTEARELDGSGNDITGDLTAPTVVSIDSTPGGEVDIVLRYNPEADATEADTWRLYVTTDGTTPNPATDSPSDTTMKVTALASPVLTQTITLGPYDYGTVVKIIPRVYSSELDDESANSTVTTETVDTQAPVQPNWLAVTTGGWAGYGFQGYDNTTYYNSPTNTVGIQILNGETVLFGSAEVFRGVLGNGNELRTDIDFVNTAHSASGTASPIEVVDADTFYINVDGTRRCKIDLTGPQIEAATFEFEEATLALPVIGPTHTTDTATYIQIFNGLTGRWAPIASVDSSGVFTAYAPVNQE